MPNFGSFIERLEYFEERLSYNNILRALAEAMRYYQQDLLGVQRDQTLLGRDSEGNPFRPGYTEDPYFSSPEAGARYASFKESLHPIHKERILYFINYPDKDTNTPNLIITGSFQDRYYINITEQTHTLGSNWERAEDVERKYNNNVFGFAPLSKEYLWKKFLAQKIKEYLWGA